MTGDNAVIGSDIRGMYHDDFDFVALETQLDLLPTLVHGQNLDTIEAFSRWLKSSPSRKYLAQVEKLTELVLVLPATNATSERSFSTLRRLKSYLRNSIGQSRLNSCLMLNCYKQITDNIDTGDIIRQFVQSHSDRAARIAT